MISTFARWGDNPTPKSKADMSLKHQKRVAIFGGIQTNRKNTQSKFAGFVGSTLINSSQASAPLLWYQDPSIRTWETGSEVLSAHCQVRGNRGTKMHEGGIEWPGCT